MKARQRLSLIEVDVRTQELSDMHKKVMSFLRQGLCDTYELRGYGRKNMIAIEDLLRQMSRWIEIKDIKSDNLKLQVIFSRSHDFMTWFR